MKKSAHTYRIFATTALLLFCIVIHQNLDAGFHIISPKKEARECKAVKKPSFSDDNFIVKALLRFAIAG